MTVDEVAAIVGCPPGDYTQGGVAYKMDKGERAFSERDRSPWHSVESWDGKTAIIAVQLDETKCVVWKSYREAQAIYSPSRRTFLDRIRSWVGW
jgi:hypothetical protein